MAEIIQKSFNDGEVKKCAMCSRVYVNEGDFFNNTSRWRICSSKHLWFNCKCGSTLMIKNGKHDWYSPDKIMSQSSASLFNRLVGLKELPKIATSIMEIQETLQQQEFDVIAISTKVRKDPFLAARLLSVASHIRTMRDPASKQPFSQIEHAVMYVGKKALSELVMTISLQSFTTKTKKFSPDKHWKEAFITAELAELISLKWGGKDSKDEIYIAAALCNIGKIVGAIVSPVQLDQLQKLVDDPKTPFNWTQAEAILKVPSHLMFGEIASAIWGLPPYVTDCISLHHSDERLTTPTNSVQNLSTADCVLLANQLLHWILLRPSRLNMNLLQKFSKCRGIPMEEIEKFASHCSYLAKRAE